MNVFSIYTPRSLFQAELKAILGFVGDMHEFKFVGLPDYSCISEDSGHVT